MLTVMRETGAMSEPIGGMQGCESLCRLEAQDLQKGGCRASRGHRWTGWLMCHTQDLVLGGGSGLGNPTEETQFASWQKNPSVWREWISEHRDGRWGTVWKVQTKSPNRSWSWVSLVLRMQGLYCPILELQILKSSVSVTDIFKQEKRKERNERMEGIRKENKRKRQRNQAC